MIKKIGDDKVLLVLIATFLVFIICFSGTKALPEGPDIANLTANETKPTTVSVQVNISGGNIATYNLTANMKNIRWKAFVGWVTGKFTLDDSTGATVYDWTVSTVNGRVFATRNGSTISWSTINCSNDSLVDLENYRMNHTSADDNITITFNNRSHAAFYVGSKYFSANICNFSLNTYVNNATQTTYFKETALFDGASIVYSTKIENHIVGYDNVPYDFQMIVPENGVPGYSGITPYYLYVELI
jgi:hypothetical protein